MGPTSPAELARRVEALAEAADALGMTLTAATLRDALRWCMVEEGRKEPDSRA